MNLVTLEAVGKTFGERVLFDHLDLRINAGDRIGLIGVNGSGKSTLLRLIAGVEVPDSGRVKVWGGVRIELLAQDPALRTGGSALEEVLQATAPGRLLVAWRAASRRLQRAPDDDAVAEEVHALAAEIDRVDAWAADVEAKAILSRLGCGDPATGVSELSGGELKRVAVARALLAPSDLLLLDEPTNHLDADAVAWLEERLRAATGGLLLVTHDRYFLDRVANRILELDRRTLVSYHGNYSRYLEQRAERQERLGAMELHRRQLLRRELEWLRRAPKARGTKQKARAGRVRELAQLEYDSGERQVAISLAGRRLGERVLSAEGLHKALGGRPVLRGIDLELSPGTRLGIIGPNGAGKTTLLDVLAGRLAPDAGTVAWGESVELGYFDQHSGALEEGSRVLDFLEARATLVTDQAGERVTAARALEWFLFDGARQHARIDSLSGGERRRLFLLWTLVRRPNVLFLDEPTNDLDVSTLHVLEEYLDAFGGALVVVSHDRYFLDRTVDELAVLEEGQWVARHPGPYETFRRLREEALAARRLSASRESAADGAHRPRRGRPRGSAAQDVRRPTWKELRELEALEVRIAELERLRGDLENEIASAGAAYLRLDSLAEDLGRANVELDALLPRWLELAELRSNAEGRSQ